MDETCYQQAPTGRVPMPTQNAGMPIVSGESGMSHTYKNKSILPELFGAAGGCIVVLLPMLIWAAFWIAIIATAWHFIHKYW